MKIKDCQFCGESIKDTAYHCNHCNHTQKDKALLSVRLIRIQVIRYLTFFLALLAPLGVFSFYIGEWSTSGQMVFELGKLVWVCICGFIFLSLFYHLVPESYLEDVKVPYMLDRIKYCRRMMVRNLLLFPALSVFLIYGQIKLAANRPDYNDFRAYLKTEKSFTEKDIVGEMRLPFLTIHIIENAKGMRYYAGLNNKFYPFDPKIFTEPIVNN